MKVRGIVYGLLFTAGVSALGACTQSVPEQQAEHGHEHAQDEKQLYTCGMHPQIVEEEPGSCPICGMDLTPMKSAPKAAPVVVAEKQSADVPLYTCPMHPDILQEEPGTCPICGMDLVLAVKEAPAKLAREGQALHIDPTVVQNMGVRIKEVKRGPIFRHIRTIGTVDIAEDQLSVVNLRYSGWVERIYVDETGVLIKRGKALFDIYSPELVSAQEEFLVALRTTGADSPLTKSARARLEYWDLPSWQIKGIAEQGKVVRSITVTAPQTGYVLHKNVVQGARIMAGSDLYRIGNLTKIWVNAEVYEFDAPWVALGQKASMELSFQKGKTYEGTVAYVYPTLNPKTRTLTVRLEFENPGLALKPGMFATVQIEAQRKSDVLVIPTEAIIHSGTRQVVFVTEVLGHYSLREITTGIVGDRYLTEVTSGLEDGEQVVTSGQFLLDSESQLQEAVQKLLAARLQAKQKPADDAPTKKTEGETYWTCGMHPQIVQDEPGSCPICGMDLTEKKQ